MCIEVTILASGSQGNAIVIHDRKQGLIIDAGLSLTEMSRRLDLAGIDPDIIKAICITHVHFDHVSGLEALINEMNIPAYITDGSYKEAKFLHVSDDNLRLFTSGESFELDPFSIQSVKVSHDIGTPVGYIIHFNGYKIGIATDLGIADENTINAMKGCNAVLLESNYDATMLRNSERPQMLKDRISSDKGHLSNAQCAEALQKVVTDQTSDVVLCHLSRDCNTPELALKSANFALQNHNDIKIITANQDHIRTIKFPKRK